MNAPLKKDEVAVVGELLSSGSVGLALSVIIPVFNEEACIAEVVDEVIEAMLPLSMAYEVLLVDDGSTDLTPSALLGVIEKHAVVRVLTLPKNAGQSAAMLEGFRSAHAPLLVTLDADGQNDPADIPALIDGIEGYDCCLGYRPERKDTWAKKAGSKFANAVRRAVLDDGAIDTGCSLKAFRMELVEQIPPFDGVHRFLPAFFKMQGARVNQVPTRHRLRSAGVSKYSNFGRLVKTVPDLIAMRWLAGRWQGKVR